MKYTLKDIEFPIMLFKMQEYMKRLHNAMKGMKYPQAEKCRMNYWRRLLQKVRENGFYPMWDDFQNFLQILTMFHPSLSQEEYEFIIDGIESEIQVQALRGTDLRTELLEIAFKDYLEQSFRQVKYLPNDQAKFRIAAFWNSVALAHALALFPFSTSNYHAFVKRFEIKDYLTINEQQIEHANSYALNVVQKLRRV
ncbi:MAG: hypothetical protein Crog4KO_26040 [Crocinitomicaceae bacterium]